MLRSGRWSRGWFAPLRLLIEAGEAQAYLALGDLATAAAWAGAAPDVGSIGEFLQFGVATYAGGVQALGCAAARILAAHSRATGDTCGPEQAERRLVAAWELAARQGLGWLRLEVLIARAMLLDCQGERDAALAALRPAVTAAPEGYVRPFVDEGAPMAALLKAARVEARTRLPDHDTVPVAFIDRLLAAFPGQAASSAASQAGGQARTPSLIEPLSPRELQVLRLLATGRSNAEMARDLVVVEGTVKSHLIHIYGKLGAHSRTQAVAHARAFGLLD